jgi:hypothetical protein
MRVSKALMAVWQEGATTSGFVVRKHLQLAVNA